MTDLSHAWQAFDKGDFSQALQLFDRGSDEPSIIGKALTMHAMGRADDAIDVVEQHLRHSRSPRLQALVADLHGRQRNRARAEKMLVRLTSQDEENGFYRSLLGEQRIRQGKWKQGTSDFIAGLNKPKNRAFPHIKRVVADMVDAVMARRIPRQDAMKFINRIDYSTSNKTQEMDQFFARARRDVNANRRMERDEIGEHWAVYLSDTSTSAPSPPPRAPSTPSGHSRPGRTRQPQRSASDTRRSPDPGTAQKQGRSQRPSREQKKKKKPPSSDHRDRQQRNQRRLAQRPQALAPQQQPTIDSQSKNMTAVMQEERRRNEALQELIDQMRPPIWPSEYEDSIDVIRPIGFSDKALLPGSQDIETANFRITQGAIGVEITLERCMHNLIAAASTAKPTTLPFTKESIPRLELNLLDPFLDAMPRLEDLYRSETEVEDSRALAVGKFIGECIVQSYGGVWEHAIPARDSVIHLGDHTLDPIGLAKEFLDARSFDAVSLRSLIDEAEEAVTTSTAFPRFADYIDPTSGLETEALVMNLAELWVGYRFVLADIELSEVVNSIDIVENAEHHIIFAIDADFVPRALIKEYDGAVDTGRKVKVAYIRDSGEFLLLGSRKHYCRFLEASGIPLRKDTASTIAEYIRDYFRPAWNVMIDSDSARKWRKKYDTTELKPPAIRKRQGEVTLRLHAVDASNSIRKIDIVHRSDQFPPYQMAIH